MTTSLRVHSPGNVAAAALAPNTVAPPADTEPVARKVRSFPKGSLMVLPAVLIIAVFGIYPVFVLILRSFGVGEVGPYEEPGPTLQYYVDAVTSMSLLKAIANSIIVGLGSVVLTVVIAIPLVLHLSRRSRQGHSTSWMDALLTFPITLPGIIIGFFSIVLIGRNGLFAQWFDPLSGMAFTYLGLFIAYIFFSIPRIIGPLRGAADMLDQGLAEVAHSLGASRSYVFRTVTLPLILPAAIEVAGTAAAVALGGYGTVAALSEGIRLLPLDVVDSLNNGYNIATSSALAVILAIMAVIALFLGQALSAAVKKWMA